MSVDMSAFEAVLDKVSNDRADGSSPRSGVWTAMRGWNSSFVAEGLRTKPWPGREQRGAVNSTDGLGASTPAPRQVTPAPRPEPATDISHFERLSPEDIAKDIDLLASDTPAELKSKRRRFARLNHPDRCPPEWREAATTRMKVANQMVDEALRRI